MSREVRIYCGDTKCGSILAEVFYETTKTVIVGWGESASTFSKETGKYIKPKKQSWDGWNLYPTVAAERLPSKIITEKAMLRQYALDNARRFHSAYERLAVKSDIKVYREWLDVRDLLNEALTNEEARAAVVACLKFYREWNPGSPVEEALKEIIQVGGNKC